MKRITLLFCLLTASLGFSQAVVIEDFEGSPILSFGNGDGTAIVVDDPETGGTNGSVLEIITAASQAPWQQAEITFQENFMDLTVTKTATIDVYSVTAFSMLARASAATDPAVLDSAADAAHTGNGWETLTFDFSDPRDGLPVANGIYSRIFLFNNWDATAQAWACTPPDGDNACPSRLSYVDNITAVPFAAPAGPDVPATPAPNPGNYTGHLALQDNITDTGSLTNFWNATYNFGAAPVFLDLDEGATVNNAAQIDLSVGWGGGIAEDGEDVITDASAYDTFHFDYYIPSNVEPGVNGHQFYMDLISRIGTENTETFYGVGIGEGTPDDGGTGVIDEQMVLDTWVGVDIPMTVLVEKGFSPSNFFQFKIAAQSDIRTQVGYFDNLYFYDSATLGTDQFNTVEFNVYPNPTKNNWNIKSSTTISSITIYDILGKQITTLAPNASDVEISTANITAGIYFARINGINGSKTVKLIKE